MNLIRQYSSLKADGKYADAEINSVNENFKAWARRLVAEFQWEQGDSVVNKSFKHRCRSCDKPMEKFHLIQATDGDEPAASKETFL